MKVQVARALSPPAFDVLVKCGPFKKLHNRDVVRIARTFHPKTFSPGDRLFTCNTAIDFVGIIQIGEVRSRVRIPDNGAVDCGLLGEGDFFGAAAALTDGLSTVDLECRDVTACYVQPLSDFHRMIETYPTLREYFMQIALRNFRQVYQAMTQRNPNDIDDSSTNVSHRKRPRAIKKALDFIDRNFNQPLSLDEVAGINGMSKYHFSRVFNEKTGVSFKEYLNRRRIAEAKRLMRDEEFNVSEACFAVGFNDLSYFSRVFYRLEGIKPSQYRKRAEDHRTFSVFNGE